MSTSGTHRRWLLVALLCLGRGKTQGAVMSQEHGGA